MCPPISSARSEAPREREPLVARLVDLLDSRRSPASFARRNARACSHVSVQATRWAPFSSPVSSRSSSRSATVRPGSSGTNTILNRDKKIGVRAAATRTLHARRHGPSPSQAVYELYRWIWVTTGWTLAVPGQRHDAPPPLDDLQGARRAVALPGAAPDHGPAQVGVVHGEGGARRASRSARSSASCSPSGSCIRGSRSARCCRTSSRRRRSRSSPSRRWSSSG